MEQLTIDYELLAKLRIKASIESKTWQNVAIDILKENTKDIKFETKNTNIPKARAIKRPF